MMPDDRDHSMKKHIFTIPDAVPFLIAYAMET
jgi:hypothetical protein